jgi:2-succinyl-5-enolpyruvyl-6-hydroxy-3-cyclohexene-1-carboxylate synthase
MSKTLLDRQPVLPLIEIFLRTRAGVVCICAGSRNTPLILLASRLPKSIVVRKFVDERSAAFFALGFAKSLKDKNKCAVVITTSGTAVAELLPAFVEAYYSQLPLVALTADRPSRFRGTGAPQCIEQVNILGRYAEKFEDFSSQEFPEKLSELREVLFQKDFNKNRLHLNIAFEDKDLDLLKSKTVLLQESHFNAENCQTQDVEESFLLHLRKLSRPVVILGPSAVPKSKVGQKKFFDFLKKLNAPIRAETQSQDLSKVFDQLLVSGDSFLKKIAFESVIRLGGVPTGRFWRDLESDALYNIPVLSLDSKPFSGLSQGRSLHLTVSNIEDFWSQIRNSETQLSKYWDEALWQQIRTLDSQVAQSIKELLKKYPNSEVGMLNSLCKATSKSCSHLFLGNSMAIREWDIVEGLNPGTRKTVESNRGANGIDGELSSFFGWMESVAKPKLGVCVLGDLTTLYDLNSPWILDQMSTGAHMDLVVINNSGGKIFSLLKSLAKLPKKKREEFWELTHDTRFQKWAEMWKMSYKAISRGSMISAGLFRPISSKSKMRVLELIPNASQSQKFWSDFRRLFQ